MKNNRLHNLLVLLSLLSFLLAAARAPSQAQEGTVTGLVKLVGNPPPPPPPTVVKPADAAVCGTHAADESIVVGAGGGLQFVIVYLEDMDTGKPASKPSRPAATVKISNMHCRFQPHVQTATAGSTLLVRSDDDILHNTHAFIDQNTTLFNIALPFKGVEVPRPLARPGMVRFKCDAGHTWMSGYILVLNHEFHATSDASGKFRIASVPAGSHRVKVWHEKLGTQIVPVQVSAGQETKLTIEFKAP